METTRIILDSIIIIIGILWIFLKSYYSEKGKNLATKEDIKEITDKIESVKLSYVKILEDYKHDLSLKNDLEKRLINSVLTDIYKLVTSSKEQIFKRQNKLLGEESDNQLFGNINQIITMISIQIQLKEKLKDELVSLLKWNNEFYLYVEKLKRTGETRYILNFDTIMNILDDIQIKIFK
jgi:hypothetical protein